MSAPVGEYETEPVRGLPDYLPAGERMLWQGAPCWKALAVRAFHIRKLALYFAVLLVWRAGTVLMDGGPLGAAALSAGSLALLALAALGVMAMLAWLTARSTVYTITSKRLVLRFGIALPMTMNLPFTCVESAALRTWPDGTGDIPLKLTGGQKASHVVLWPHVRPWHMGVTQPMLRALPEAASVAECLSAALAASAGTEAWRAEQPPAAASKPRRSTPPLVTAVN